MSTDDNCDYCYGTMGECPKCGPFEYAGPVSAGYGSRSPTQATDTSGARQPR